MCMINSFIVKKVEENKVNELRDAICNEVMKDYVLNKLSDLIYDLQKEVIDCYGKTCITIREKYMNKCKINDLKLEIGRYKKVKEYIEKMN